MELKNMTDEELQKITERLIKAKETVENFTGSYGEFRQMMDDDLLNEKCISYDPFDGYPLKQMSAVQQDLYKAAADFIDVYYAKDNSYRTGN